MRFALFVIVSFFSQLAYSQNNQDYVLETLAEELNRPWSIAFLPNGGCLLAMQTGEIRKVSNINDELVVSAAFKNIPDTYFASQGGYFDIALDPEFSSNNTVYLSRAILCCIAKGNLGR